jgi:hypothetical protein
MQQCAADMQYRRLVAGQWHMPCCRHERAVPWLAQRTVECVAAVRVAGVLF